MGTSSRKSGFDIEITEEIRSSLQRRLMATGLTPRKFIRKTINKPHGFNSDLLTKILSGEVTEMRELYYNHLDTALTLAIDAKDAEKAAKQRGIEKRKAKNSEIWHKRVEGYEVIPQSMRDKILKEVNRTGNSVSRMLQIGGREKDISSKIMSDLARGINISGPKQDVEDLLELFSKEETAQKEKISGRLPVGYRYITAQDLRELKRQINRTGVNPYAFAGIMRVKASSQTILDWVSGKIKSCKETEWEEVLRYYKYLRSNIV